MKEREENGCPISRVLCEKWGFWIPPISGYRTLAARFAVRMLFEMSQARSQQRRFTAVSPEASALPEPPSAPPPVSLESSSPES